MKYRLWPYVGLLAVASVWGISALANFYAGLSLASDPVISTILGGASVACDVLKAVSMFVVFGALTNKRPGTAAVAVLMFVLCSMWSLRSATYFAADAISSKQAAVEHSSQIALAKLQLTDTKQRRATFLAEQRVQVNAQNKLARREAIAENQRGSVEFKALTSDIEQDISGLELAAPVAVRDPIAATFGLDEKQVSLATALAFAVLLEFCSAVGFLVIARSRTAPAVAQAVPEAAPVEVVAEAKPELAAPTGYGQGGFGEQAIAAALPDLVEPPAAEPSNVIAMDDKERDEARLVLAIGGVLEPAGAGDRVLLSNVAARVNALLPRAKRINGRRGVGDVLAPAIAVAFPHSQRQRVGGQTWAYGVRLRCSTESVTMAA